MLPSAIAEGSRDGSIPLIFSWLHTLHFPNWLTIPEAVCMVMFSWWWAEEPPETCRASVKINKFKKHCILLAVICNYITMHGRINIKNLIPVLQWPMIVENSTRSQNYYSGNSAGLSVDQEVLESFHRRSAVWFPVAAMPSRFNFHN
jgi:hypothetical protein